MFLISYSLLASSCLNSAQICDAECATPDNAPPVYTGVGARSRRAVARNSAENLRANKSKEIFLAKKKQEDKRAADCGVACACLHGGRRADKTLRRKQAACSG